MKVSTEIKGLEEEVALMLWRRVWAVVTAAVIADVAVEVEAAAPTPNIARDYILFLFF